MYLLYFNILACPLCNLRYLSNHVQSYKSLTISHYLTQSLTQSHIQSHTISHTISHTLSHTISHITSHTISHTGNEAGRFHDDLRPSGYLACLVCNSHAQSLHRPSLRYLSKVFVHIPLSYILPCLLYM